MSKDILKRMNDYLNEESKIDWEAVKEAVKDAAEDIHEKPDMNIINDMIEKVKKGGKAKDTEDAVQIVINMMRSES